jgi:hypothetical protein
VTRTGRGRLGLAWLVRIREGWSSRFITRRPGIFLCYASLPVPIVVDQAEGGCHSESLLAIQIPDVAWSPPRSEIDIETVLALGPLKLRGRCHRYQAQAMRRVRLVRTDQKLGFLHSFIHSPGSSVLVTTTNRMSLAASCYNPRIALCYTQLHVQIVHTRRVESRRSRRWVDIT